MNVSFKIGTRAQFDSMTSFKKGAFYFCKDTGELFHGGGSETDPDGDVSAAEMILINSATTYVTCATAASTQAKAVTGVKGFVLAKGTRVLTKFSNGNSANNPTLNINSTGAKPIYYNGARISRYALSTGKLYEFVYDGTNYVLVGDVRSTIEISQSEATTSYSIAHNLGCYPQVLALDPDGYSVEISVKYTDKNNLTVYWNDSFTGKIIIQS